MTAWDGGKPAADWRNDGKAVIELAAKARYRFAMKQSDIILADPESLGGTPVSTGTSEHDQHA
jgi:hypothetical protein